jgi:hypothetical protein
VREGYRYEKCGVEIFVVGGRCMASIQCSEELCISLKFYTFSSWGIWSPASPEPLVQGIGSVSDTSSNPLEVSLLSMLILGKGGVGLEYPEEDSEDILLVYFDLEYPEDEDMLLENAKERKDDLLEYPEDCENTPPEYPEDSGNILLEDPKDCE